MRPSAVIKSQHDLLSGGLDAAAGALWNSRPLGPIYREYLFYQHCSIRASVPLMEAAVARCLMLADPVARALVPYLDQHIAEEQGHDVWVLEDLAELGVSADGVLARVPPASIAAMVGAQYYWIHHAHPVALLGYLWVLESTPPDAAHLARRAEEEGLPLAAFRTLLRHADADPLHGRDLEALLDALPLDASQRALVGVSMIATTHALEQALREIVEHGSARPAS